MSDFNPDQFGDADLVEMLSWAVTVLARSMVMEMAAADPALSERDMLGLLAQVTAENITSAPQVMKDVAYVMATKAVEIGEEKFAEQEEMLNKFREELDGL